MSIVQAVENFGSNRDKKSGEQMRDVLESFVNGVGTSVICVVMEEVEGAETNNCRD
jgi:hypothetical protein